MTRPVVAAAIVDSLSEPTMLLACSRAYPQELRGQFELPGGKVEDNEDPVHALAREIAEELGARVLLRQVRTGDGAPHHDPLRLAAALRDAFDGFLGEVGQSETWLP